MADWRRELQRRLRGEALPDERLAPRTSIRVGGPADLLVRPADPDDLAELLRGVAELGVPLTILGGGANTLVADAGVRGVVVRLPPDLGEERTDGPLLTLPAGAPIARLMARGHALGLTGAEFLAGVPGTLGGALAMNAGTPAGELVRVLVRAELATADGTGFVPAAALGLGYRRSHLPPGAVVTRLECRLTPGDVPASRALMEADVARRRATQPLDRPSFGSTFWNPPGRFAGQLIEAVGLKGYRVGGAMWSDVHANFLVNLGGATAHDVLALMKLARARVKAAFGLPLEAEVKLVGEFLAEDVQEA
ncbi:MAG: UDP-N-acetylmuramate dehydrogenase [Anaeromyxobacter sp.]|nr:UDP-N-acetylmuramate dehydrogenase [Anaeromyxobacter sp.]MBL0275646.1 UDP-N-acetylmuramate dehydrogenase [Anaeromyxobacter sp.]